MKSLSIVSLLAVLAATAQEESPSRAMGHSLAKRWSGRLQAIEQRVGDIVSEVRTLPAMPDLDALGTHGFHSNFTPGSEGNWFEISWSNPFKIDALAMIPTRLTTQSGMRSNYGFPRRLRVEAKGTDGVARILAEVDDTHLDLRRGDPLFLSFPEIEAVSLRFIPLELDPLPGKDVRFFSLAELLVFSGENNVSTKGSFNAPYSIDTEVGWNLRYLNDGQSPLGPPELPIPGNSLGWHAEGVFPDPRTWAMIDLGMLREFDRIRLIPARGDAPIKGPGFGFPERFSLHVFDTPDGHGVREIWTTGDTAFPNPGYNPVDLRIPPTIGRYVRLKVSAYHSPDPLTTPRVLISEMEVRQGEMNLALERPVSTPEAKASIPHDAKRVWSRAGLTDGYSSTGRLIPTRRWVADLSRRFDLFREQRDLEAERGQIITLYQTAMLVSIFGILGVGLLGMLVWQIRTRRNNRRQIAELRRRISSDLHDEVGSNLATIALLSELPPVGASLDDINRLSRESSQSLREIVEITLAPKIARNPINERLREIAALMLCNQRWTFESNGEAEVDLEQRRNLVFYFKEALHNIIRHANASVVRLSLDALASEVRLVIEDDGQGILEASADVTHNLRTLHQRAASLRGTLSVESVVTRGTRLTLTFPVLKKLLR